MVLNNFRVFPLKFFLDLLSFALASPLAFLLRLEGPFTNYFRELVIFTAVSLPIAAGVIFFSGLYRQSWQKTSIPDLYHLVQATGFYLLINYVLWVALVNLVWIPRSIPLLSAGISLFFTSGLRMGTRILFEQMRKLRFSGTKRRVLIVGSGEAGTMVARDMLRHPEMGLIPVGFLDDDPLKRQTSFMGIKVLGSLSDMKEVIRRIPVDEVLIAIPSAPGSVVRKVVEEAKELGLRYRIIPGLYEILSGKVSISQIREVEVEDLLRRDPVQLDMGQISAYLENRTVLVTGAGGSIGSEIVRQVARFAPERILLLGKGENSLFHIHQMMEHAFPAIEFKIIVADVRDRDKIQKIFQMYRPHAVFHAAAHKHVPLMEANPDEAIFNNALGTQVMVEVALKFQVERFVNISTDKAVNPISILGASKRVAELVVVCASRKAAPNQVFVSVRFGNVLGSRGSVVPLFKDQIRRGGPVTITHPKMTRYFMTITEAAQLVLQAAGLGENGAIYVLDMGEPIRIVDLARDLIRLSGLEPEVDIPIIYTGIRPGEKLHEELFDPSTVKATQHEKIFVVYENEPAHEAQFYAHLEQLYRAAYTRDASTIRKSLKEILPNYNPGAWLSLEKPLTAVAKRS